VRDDIARSNNYKPVRDKLHAQPTSSSLSRFIVPNFSSSGQISSQSTRGAAQAKHQQHGNRRLHPTDAWEQHNSIVKFIQTQRRLDAEIE